MSWQAVRKVVMYGPDDDKLWRLLAVVAEGADADGRGSKIGYRLLSERCAGTMYRIRELLFTAIDDGWLQVVRRGSGRGKSIYDLGPRLASREVTRGVAREIPREVCEIDAQNRALAREIEREIAHGPVQRTGTGRAARPAGGRRAPVGPTKPTPRVPADPPSANGEFSYVYDQDGNRYRVPAARTSWEPRLQ